MLNRPAIPLLAMRILLMVRLPPNCLTSSSAVATLLPLLDGEADTGGVGFDDAAEAPLSDLESESPPAAADATCVYKLPFPTWFPILISK